MAYGNIHNMNECKYSLLKYLHKYNLDPPGNIAIIIYTDQPIFFEQYVAFFKTIIIKEITLDQVKTWQGENNFVFRTKIQIIRDFFLVYTGNLLYCDTDTYVLNPLQDIFDDIEKGSFYMHRFEGLLGDKSNSYFRKWNNFLSANSIEYISKKLIYSPGIQMWNAGIIGLSSSSCDLVNDVLSLSDNIYEKFPKHIAEQFAFGYCLQHAGTIKSAEKTFAHYWDLKEFRIILENFFNAGNKNGIPELVEKAEALNINLIQKEKNDFENLNLLKKSYRRIIGQKWSIHKY